jgi:hypothetical protein
VPTELNFELAKLASPLPAPIFETGVTHPSYERALTRKRKKRVKGEILVLKDTNIAATCFHPSPLLFPKLPYK